jgi:hypothetical protein
MPDLDTILATLYVQVESPVAAGAGYQVVARVASLHPLTLTDILSLPLDLSIIGKGMRFVDEELTNLAIKGPLKAFDLTKVPPEIDPGVPGLLGRIAGALPVPVTVAIQVRVTWSVHRVGGPFEFDTELDENEEFIAPSGLTSPEVLVLIAPPVVELTRDEPPLIAMRVRASVRLAAQTSAGLLETGPRVIEAPFAVPALPIPTVLALFRGSNYSDVVLVMVPESSPAADEVDLLNNILLPLQQRIATLLWAGRFVAFLVGLQFLTSKLGNRKTAFEKNDGRANLNGIKLINRPWPEDDTEAENELSSIVFVGASGRQVACFNARRYKGGDGWFTLTVREKLHAKVPSLHSKKPESGPDGTELVVRRKPAGHHQKSVTPSGDNLWAGGTFNNSLSSVRFEWQSVSALAAAAQGRRSERLRFERGPRRKRRIRKTKP